MAKSMKVVFRSDVRGIAQAGDVKTVRPGYARNYLFPQKLAFPATAAALRQWETERQGWLNKAQRKREEAQSLAQRVESTSCVISAKVANEGRLYGSIGRNEILDALAKQGVVVDKQSILLAEPIRQVGVSMVSVRVGTGIQTQLKVEVVPEVQPQ